MSGCHGILSLSLIFIILTNNKISMSVELKYRPAASTKDASTLLAIFHVNARKGIILVGQIVLVWNFAYIAC